MKTSSIIAIGAAFAGYVFGRKMWCTDMCGLEQDIRNLMDEVVSESSLESAFRDGWKAHHEFAASRPTIVFAGNVFQFEKFCWENRKSLTHPLYARSPMILNEFPPPYEVAFVGTFKERTDYLVFNKMLFDRGSTEWVPEVKLKEAV